MRNVATSYRWLLVGGAFDFLWLTAAGIRDYDVPDATDFVISATIPAPQWATESVVYQVFPDRFARSHGVAASPAQAPEGVAVPGWAVPRAWTDRPEGRSGNTSAEYFGGDLDGVRQHLDHVTSLGANVLYMTPVFPAGSTHRYDASSFAVVDPLLGGTAALTRLVEAAHERDVRVIGDITLNHCGREHEWFVRAQDPQSLEREFFRFDPALKYGYECWFNVPTLPKFDHTSTRLRERLVTSLDAPVRAWLRGPSGLDGWRVDVANMAGRMGSVDVTHQFARDVREAMALESEDALLVAEHGHDASGDLLGDGWHGTMNYAGFTRQVLVLAARSRLPRDVHGTARGGPGHLGGADGCLDEGLPWPHPVAIADRELEHPQQPRHRSHPHGGGHRGAAGGRARTGRRTPWCSDGVRRRRDRCHGILGRGRSDALPVARRGWLGRFHALGLPPLIGLRTSSPALATGGLRWLHVTADSVAFVREHPDQSVLVVAARHQCEDVRIPLAALHASGISHQFGFDAQVVAGQIVISVPSAGAGVWQVEGE